MIGDSLNEDARMGEVVTWDQSHRTVMHAVDPTAPTTADIVNAMYVFADRFAASEPAYDRDVVVRILVQWEVQSERLAADAVAERLRKG